MMNRFIGRFLIGLVAFGIAANLQAATYYSYEGSITSVLFDNTGSIASALGGIPFDAYDLNYVFEVEGATANLISGGLITTPLNLDGVGVANAGISVTDSSTTPNYFLGLNGNWNTLLSVVTGYEYYTDGVLASQLATSVTLTSVSAVNPIPVPAAFLLMGSGLLGLLAFGRRKKTA